MFVFFAPGGLHQYRYCFIETAMFGTARSNQDTAVVTNTCFTIMGMSVKSVKTGAIYTEAPKQLSTFLHGVTTLIIYIYTYIHTRMYSCLWRRRIMT